MGVSYDGLGSELISESERGIWKAGKRCPDIYLSRVGGNTKRLYSMLSYGKFVVLSIGGRQGCHRYFADVCTHLTLLPGVSRQEDANGHSEGAPPVECNIFSSDVVVEDQDFVVVVRPDMYIGYVGEGEGWRDYLAIIFTH